MSACRARDLWCNAVPRIAVALLRIHLHVLLETVAVDGLIEVRSRVPVAVLRTR